MFTWGCLVAYAGTDRHPYGTGDPVALAGRVLHGEPDLTGLPVPLVMIVRAALGRDPAGRPTARELLLTLTGGSVSGPATARIDLSPTLTTEVLPTPVLEAASPRPVRRLVLGGLVFVIGVVLLVSGVLLFHP